MTMLAISQKPERVSNILRSSTPTRRDIGTRLCSARICWTGRSTTRAVMLLFLLVGCRR